MNYWVRSIPSLLARCVGRPVRDAGWLAARSQAAQMQADEKLLLQPSFRAPMLAKIPYPPWALKREDVDLNAAGSAEADETPQAAQKISRRESDFA